MRQTFAVTHATTDLPDDILREIGKTIVLFANLEWRLSRFTYAILGVDRNVGRIAVSEPRASDRFDRVCELLTYKNATSKADLSGIMAQTPQAILRPPAHLIPKGVSQ